MKFTYFSFKNMTDLSMDDLNDLDNHLFKIITATEKLLYGGLNHNPRKTYTQKDVEEYMVALADSEDENESVIELFTNLMEELDKSGFFKQLQRASAKTETSK